jgi:N4-(beta-N-acetylglucosaminyl)-L-asparaginase
VLLAGQGALEFARAQGFVEENLLTERARKIWLYWKQTHSDKDDWLPPQGAIDPEVARFFKLDQRAGAAPQTGAQSNVDFRKLHRPMGTVHVAALNDRQEISCCTSTSGLAFKIAGRVGDSPIPGAGLFVDNDVGSCGSTGRGEAAMVSVASFCAVELMRTGARPLEAGLETLRRVASATREPALLDERGQPAFNLSLYLLARNGAHAGVTMRGNVKFAVCDQQGPRLEDCRALFNDA